MATTVTRQVSIYIQSGEAEKAYDRLIAKEKSLKSELEKTTNAAERTRLTNELKKLEEPIDRAAKKLKGELTPSMRDLQTTISRLQNQLKTQGIGDAEFNRLTVALRKAKIEMAEANARMQAINDTASKGSFFSRVGSGVNELSQSAFGVGFGPLAAITAAGAGLNLAIQEAFEAEEHISRFRTTLENMGKDNLFDPLAKQAEELSNKLKFFGADDTYVIFTKLLDYGKLTQQEIQQLTPIIIDFATKQKMSFEQAADEVIKGFTGSSREIKKYGVDLAEATTTTERFSMIVDQLGPKVAGSASAFGEIPQGRIAKMREQVNDLAGDIGEKLMPAITVLTQGVTFFVVGLAELFSKVGDGFNFIFNRAKFEADQMMAEVRKHRAEVEQFSTNVASSFFKQNTDQLTAQLQAETTALLNAQKGVDKRLKDDFDGMLSYFQQRVEEQTGIVQRIEAELQRRRDIEERDRKEKEEKAKAAAEKEKAIREKAAQELNKLLDDIARKNEELGLYNSSQLAKDLARVDEYYEGLTVRAKGNKELIEEIEDLHGRETALIIQKYRDQWEKEELAAAKATAKKKSDEQLKLERDRMVKLLQSQASVIQSVAESAARAMGDAQAAAELKLIEARGRDRLAAELELLKLQEAQELAATDLTEQQKELIRARYRQKRADAEVEGWKATVADIIDAAQQILTQFSNINSIITDQENQALEADRIRNEKKKENFKRQLEGKAISQQEYDRKVQNLEKQQEAREKQVRLRQFNRDKIQNLVQATINTANAVTAGLSRGPAYAAFIGALGLIQIGLIAAQKPPKFAKGGYLPGPTHSEGGMPVINPRTGRKVAEVEGGEVILSRNTVRNNASLVDQLLHSSMYRGGATINPAWRNASPSYLNIPVITSGMQTVRKFETGGVMPAPDNSQPDETMIALVDTINALRAQLSGGIKAYTLLSDQEIQQNRMENLRNEITMK